MALITVELQYNTMKHLQSRLTLYVHIIDGNRRLSESLEKGA